MAATNVTQENDKRRAEKLEEEIQQQLNTHKELKTSSMSILKRAQEANQALLPSEDTLYSTSISYQTHTTTSLITQDEKPTNSSNIPPLRSWLEQSVIVVLLDPNLQELLDSAELLKVVCTNVPHFQKKLEDHLGTDATPKAQQKWIENVLRVITQISPTALKLEEWTGKKKKLVLMEINRMVLQTLSHSIKTTHTGSRFEVATGATQKRPRLDDQRKGDPNIDSLIQYTSVKQSHQQKLRNEMTQLLGAETTKQREQTEKFKSKNGPKIQKFCPHKTKDACRQNSDTPYPCDLVHFRKIIHPHTDTHLGDCSYLDTCRHMKTCKYVHYVLDRSTHPQQQITRPQQPIKSMQWINCDIRSFDFEVIGKVGVIMADPPWDIHMELPYGTMKDDEMRSLNIQCLQDDGLFFLWVTGRAMELGRELFQLWGYKRVAEIIWVKTNQLQRIICTGRTGHWLNHSKEHCLVGIKGNPIVNRAIDCDVIVAEVRETSRKPDEIYALIERVSPGTKKLELFGRPHNRYPGWITLGNQLDGYHIEDADIKQRYESKYVFGDQ